MRRVLIISPHFPPVNLPDMHRVRQSLPYLRDLGWDPVVIAVDPAFVEGSKDELLLATVSSSVDVRRVRALDPRITRRVGLGSLGLRSLGSVRREGDRILAEGDIDLVYFTTTQFPVTLLGRYWKRRFGVPFVVDMQDPWRSDHYRRAPRDQKPPKFWASYTLDRLLEPIALSGADGLVAVSDDYNRTLKARYPRLRDVPAAEIPFGGPEADFDFLDQLDLENRFFERRPDRVNVVYVGRGGHDMGRAGRAIFAALAEGLRRFPTLFEPVRLHFIGTDYAPSGRGRETLRPLAAEFGVEARVNEYPERVSYFTALHLLREADMAVIPGSEDPSYTASKLYPYILARRPILAVFNKSSSVINVLEQTRAGEAVTFAASTGLDDLSRGVLNAWSGMLARLPYVPDTDWNAFGPYTAREMTRRQVALFEDVLQSVPA